MLIAHSDLVTDVITTVFLPMVSHLQWDLNSNARFPPMGMNCVCMSTSKWNRFPYLSRQLLVLFLWIMSMRLNWLAANFAMFRDEDLGHCVCFGSQKLEVQVLSSLLQTMDCLHVFYIGSKTNNSELQQWTERWLSKAWLQKHLHSKFK